MASGEQYFQNRKYEESVIQLRNALKIDPSYLDAIHQIAEAEIALRNWREAAAFLERGIALDTGRSDLRFSLARLYLVTHQYQDAERQIAVLLQRSPNDVRVYEIRGSLAILKQEYPAAREVFGRMAELEPRNSAHLMNRALVDIALRDYGSAERDLERAIEIQPSSAESYLSLARFHRFRGKLAEAERVARMGLDCCPGDVSLYLFLADILAANNQDKERDELLLLLVRQNPTSVQVALELGDYHVSRAEMNRAFAHYQRGLKLAPENLTLKRRLVEWYLSQGLTNDAEALNAQVLRSEPKDVLGGIARGRILLARGQTHESIAALARQVKEAPDSPSAHYFLALAHQSSAHPVQAAAELREALRLSPGLLPARQVLTSILSDSGDYSEARSLAEQSALANPSGFAEQWMLGSVCLRQGDWKAALSHLSIAHRLSHENMQVGLAYAEALAGAGSSNDAEREFQRWIAADSQSIDAVSHFAFFLAKHKQYARAIAIVQQFVGAHSGVPGAFLLLATLQTEAGQRNAALASLHTGLQLEPRLVRAHLLAAKIRSDMGDWSGAAADYETAYSLEKSPETATVLGNLCLRQNRISEARTWFADAVSLNRDYAPAAANLAWIEAQDNGGLESALNLARRAHDLMPAAPAITDTLGWVWFRKGVYHAALPLFQQCVEQVPGSSRYRFHLGLSWLAVGEERRGQAELQTALSLGLGGADAVLARQKLHFTE